MSGPRPGALVVTGADLGRGGLQDVRIVAGVVAEVAPRLAPRPGDEVIDAGGGALLPGLRDHHIHLRALAAASTSEPCGPPAVRTGAELRDALRRHRPGLGWLRGVGYHESVAGPLDRARLDQMVDDRPVRIQHRSGQLWVVNSRGAEALGLEPSHDGRLLHADGWLRHRLGPDDDLDVRLAEVGARLAVRGVTGVADATDRNGAGEVTALAAAIPQEVLVMGGDGAGPGPRKIMLHDDRLPTLERLVATIRGARDQDRVVAIHVVSRASLWLSIVAIEEAGAGPGTRIEHGSVLPPDALPALRRLGVTVITQPNFVAERGDAYLDAVDEDDRPWLYRVAGLQRGGVAVAAGTDAPYGDDDPWRAMAAAVDRRTPSGAVLGPDERVTPEAALALFSGPLDRPDQPCVIRPGAVADLCLLRQPWVAARRALRADLVAATIRRGQILYRAGQVSSQTPTP